MFRIVLLSFLAVPLFAAASAMAGMQEGRAAFASGNYRLAYDIWHRDARAGQPEAQVALGLLYAGGKGVKQDAREAVRWYRRATAQNDPGGMHMLGLAYLTGKGVAMDQAVGAKLIGRAAQAGFKPAQVSVAIYRMLGLDIPGPAVDLDREALPDDVRTAAERLKRAAQKDEP